MIAVSDAWKDIQQRFVLPETFVEVSCVIPENNVQETATATGTNEEVFSQVENIAGNVATTTTKRYATMEPNLWVLDGSMGILPALEPYPNIGYVSTRDSLAKVVLSLSEVSTVAVPGVTIVWSSEYGEYATKFSVTAKNGDTVVATTYVDNNRSSKSLVDLDMVNYNRVEVEVYEWCLPNHRIRIDRVSIGFVMTFTKHELLSFTHEQQGDLNSGELPKNSITFSVDNLDGRWNPNNPDGIERYLSERQKVTVRYGMDVNGTTEWIKGGVFYLSEWKAPANGLEATFVARDALEFLLYQEYPGIAYGNLSMLIRTATDSFLPNNALVLDKVLDKYPTTAYGEQTRAELVQKCANAGCCIIRYDRDGVLHIEPLNKVSSGYVITQALSYSHPETTLSKPLKEVLVSYDGDEPYKLTVTASGESQTVDNPMVSTEAQAKVVAKWVKDTMISRKTVSGEFRADPRLDLYDVVIVESKYGNISPVVLTGITYTYNGAFSASYVGRVLS